MSAIATNGRFDVAGRRLTRLPFQLAVDLNGLQEQLEARGIGLLLLCRDCLGRGLRRSESVIEGDYAGGNSVTLTCTCTRRELTKGR